MDATGEAPGGGSGGDSSDNSELEEMARDALADLDLDRSGSVSGSC